MTGKQEKRWAVVCPRFVSAGFATKGEAQDHLIATKDVNQTCVGPHTVEFTNLDYGTRPRETK